jgi:2-succinyl-6-hydroxy-2,4-cyclohexadiene-1-carboxylate synthase
MTRSLCLLHGFTGTRESWTEVVRFLPPTIETVQQRILGHHPDLIDCRVESFDEEVDRLAARIRDWRREPVEVVGYSLGARLALGLAVRHPAQVARAWLIGVHPGLAEGLERDERAQADRIWAELLEREGIAPFVDRWEAQELFATQRELPEQVRRTERLRRLAHDPKGLARALRALGLAAMPDRDADLAKVAMPVELVVGELDAKFLGLARQVAARTPGATLRVVPGCGHNVVLERPEELAAILKEERR